MDARNLKKLFAMLIVIVFSLLPMAALAPNQDNIEGLAADTLTITVGYFGGPYYVKRVFSLEDLRSIGVQHHTYTFIDNMPSVVINHAEGVPLAAIIDAAGIDIGSVQGFNFWTNDKQGGYFTSMTKAFLIDTPRYRYYSLPDNWDYDYGSANEYAMLDAALVPTMISLADDWRRAIAGATFGSGFLNLNPNTRFRLVYGQTDVQTRTASESAKWIHRIEVTLGGAPTLTMDESVLELMVGSRFRSEARIRAADPIIAENAVIMWSSSDESVATVDQDGEITMHTEGTAVITAEFAGQSVSVPVSGIGAAEEPTVPQPEGAASDSRHPSGGGGAPDNQHQPGGGQSEAYASDNQPPPEPVIMPIDPEPIPAAPAVDTPTVDTPTVDTPAVDVPAVDTPAVDAPALPGRTVVPAPGTAPVLIGREISILPPPAAISDSDDGGVQNWRTGEMAGMAVELPTIAEDTDLAFVFIAIAALLCGVAYKVIEFKGEM